MKHFGARSAPENLGIWDPEAWGSKGNDAFRRAKRAGKNGPRQELLRLRQELLQAHERLDAANAEVEALRAFRRRAMPVLKSFLTPQVIHVCVCM